MKLILILLSILGSIVYFAWICSSWSITVSHHLGHEPRDVVRDIYHELRPFYWPAVLALHVQDIITDGLAAYALNWLHYVYWAGFIYLWIEFKDIDDDDRWKRRRKKLAEAVKRVGDRLIIVTPVPTRT